MSSGRDIEDGNEELPKENFKCKDLVAEWIKCRIYIQP